MVSRLRTAAIFAAALVLFYPPPASAADFVIGAFEGDLASPYANPWQVQNGTSTFTAEGATEGSFAIEHTALEDAPDNPETPEDDPYEGNGWHFRLFLDGGPDLATAVATYDTLSMDITVPQLDGWRQLFVVNQGDGGAGYYANWSSAHFSALNAGLNTITFDLSDAAAGNPKAGAQPGEGTPQWWQMFIVIQGDYDSAPFTHQIDNIRFGTAGPALTADFDDSTVVDDLDLDIWTDNFGATGQTDNSLGDANLDTEVDGADNLVWQQELNMPTAGVGAIPEPTAATLAVVAGAHWLFGRRRRRAT